MSNAPNSELEHEISMLRAFFASAPAMLGIAEVENDDIRHVADNPAAGVFFDRPPEAMRGKLASELGISAEIIRLWVQHYRRAESAGGPVQFEYEHDRP